MEQFRSIWRENGEWFALGHDDLVYALRPAVWHGGELQRAAYWEMEDYAFPGDVGVVR